MRVNSVEAFHVINVGLGVCVLRFDQSHTNKSLKTGRLTQKKGFLENVTQKKCSLPKLWTLNEADSRRFCGGRQGDKYPLSVLPGRTAAGCRDDDVEHFMGLDEWIGA